MLSSSSDGTVGRFELGSVAASTSNGNEKEGRASDISSAEFPALHRMCFSAFYVLFVFGFEVYIYIFRYMCIYIHIYIFRYMCIYIYVLVCDPVWVLNIYIYKYLDSVCCVLLSQLLKLWLVAMNAYLFELYVFFGYLERKQS